MSWQLSRNALEGSRKLCRRVLSAFVLDRSLHEQVSFLLPTSSATGSLHADPLCDFRRLHGAIGDTDSVELEAVHLVIHVHVLLHILSKTTTQGAPTQGHTI